MKTFQLSWILYLTSLWFCFGQDYPRNDNAKCGTDILYENQRQIIDDGEQLMSPYNGIFQLKVTRAFFMEKYSTASFLGDRLVITANHNIMYSPFITNIEFYLNGKWIPVKRKNIKIHHFHQSLFHKKNKDIGLIELKDIKAIRNIEHVNFVPIDFENFDAERSFQYHLTGFPSDYKGPVLVDKTTDYSGLTIDSHTKKQLGYEKLYTCKGDSGAPLWFESEGRFYVAGIHHGRNSSSFQGISRNICTRIDAEVLSWISTIQPF